MSASREVEFIAGIAHDLKTPLATIATSAELLEQDLDAATSTRLVSIIQRQAERLQSIVQDLSDYFSLGAGRLVLHPETLDLTELIRDFCVEFQELDSNHNLDFLLPASSILIQADRAKVRRILENLLRNAFKYTPDGTTVHASLKSVTTDGAPCVVIEIEDEGAGIPEEARAKIFDPFVRLENSRGQGEGLGLNIVQQLAEAHGGSAWVESTTLGGARFCVRLPFTSAPAR